MTQIVYGKNVVLQLLKEDTKVYELLLMKGIKDQRLVQIAKAQQIPVRWMTRDQLDKKTKNTHHQGIAAVIDEYRTYTIEELLASVPQGKNGLFVMLDELEDPHNLGAILRSCDAVGADGIIIGKHRSVSLTPTVAKVSTGAIHSVKVSTVTNLSQTLQYMKEQGYWVIGADLEDAKDYREGSYDMPMVLVIGSEGFGLRPLVKKQCDYFVRLPMIGKVNSLNASVACAILLYKIFEQRYPLSK